jgi:P-type conjugative transfer protein TrbG
MSVIPHSGRLLMAAMVASTLTACANAARPPVISYDDAAFKPAARQAEVAAANVSKPIEMVDLPKVLPLPGQLKPIPSFAKISAGETSDPRRRVASANAAARIQPSRDGYLNAVQVYPYSEGELYQVYASPGEITDITLQPGETLAGSGPIAAGDTVRWIIGETESGVGGTKRIHVLLKPTRADLSTNLVIDTDRRTYHLELRATPATYMASVSWRYPEDELMALKRTSIEVQANAAVDQGLDLAQLQFRYAITGDSPAWRPLRAFDDGRRVYIEMPGGVAEGELPPLFVVGSTGGTELVNYRVKQNYYVVDRLFAAAELRMGSDKKQAVVRIARTDGRPAR